MPLLDTVVLFAAADPSDTKHEKAVKYMQELKKEKFYIASFAYLEFDIILKSRGFNPMERMEIHALMIKEFPYAKLHPLSPATMYLTARIEREYNLDYFDAGVAAEALQHDGVVISTDKAFEKVNGIKRVW